MSVIQHTDMVAPSEARKFARVSFSELDVWSAPVGTKLEAYIAKAFPDAVPMTRAPGARADRTIVAAIVEGRLRELTISIERDTTVVPVYLHEGDGLRIYRRSLSLLMLTAANELFPGRKMQVSHALPFGGYYCEPVDKDNPFTPEEINQIKARMREIVDADEPIIRVQVSLEEGTQYFEERGDRATIRVLRSRDRDVITLYQLREYQETLYGYNVPSTGYLQVWDLTSDGTGFILHYPRRHAPTEIQAVTTLPKLRSVYEETGRWNDLMGVRDIGALNAAIRGHRARELILVAEALHESKYADVADMVVARQPDVRLMLIAGPSSAGKTSSAKRIGVQLMAHGLTPFTLAMDDYFVNRDDTPLDDSGEFDFEHLYAVDVELFNKHVNALMAGEEVTLPHFNFRTGMREKGQKVQLNDSTVLIVEGIHGLNPELVRDIPDARLFRMYISCLTQLNIDRHNRIPTTDVRLLRRLVRDAAYRGYSAMDTLGRWSSVRAGERKWIFPYQENADVMFNSALVYELAVLRPLAEPLLRQVEYGTRHHMEANRLLSFLRWVETLDEPDLVPSNSILREFTGGSILRDYVPGHPGQMGAFVTPSEE